MDDDFNVDAAVDEIGDGLGFGSEGSDDGEVNLEVDPPKNDEPETPAAVQPAAKAEPEAPAQAEEPAAAAPAADSAPRTWRKEAAAVWAGLPSEAKNEILKREQDMFNGIEQYKEGANYATNFRQAISQFEPILKANNMDPIQTAASLFSAHHALATSSPERKIELLRTLAADYGIDIAQAALYEAPYVDPAVAALQEQLSLVQSRLAESDRQIQTRAAATVSAEVTAFAEKNPYFDEVSGTITQLISSGTAKTLKEAYDQAVWMNPATRAKEIAKQTAEAAAKAQAKVTSVKQATAANVKTRGKSGSTAAPTGTLDDTLDSTLAEIRSRA